MPLPPRPCRRKFSIGWRLTYPARETVMTTSSSAIRSCDVEIALVGLELRAPRVRELLLDLEQLLRDDRADLLRILEQAFQVADPREQVLVLLLELGPGQPGEAPKRHVQDVVRLDLAQLELRHQLAPRLLGVLRAADHLDDRVEVVERDQQALDDVVALLGLLQLVARAPGDDVDLVVDVVADHLGEVQRPGDAVDEREHDHAEAVLQLRVLVELVQDDLRVGAALELDDQAHALAPARMVLHVRDVLQPSGAHEVGDLLGEPGLVHLVGQLGHHDPLAAVGGLLDRRDGPDLDRAPPGLVRFLDAVAAHDDRAGREVRTLDELHQVLRLGLGMLDEVHDRVDHLAEVVGRDVRRHPDGDPPRTVDEQVGEASREHDRLLLVAVVVRDEIDRLGLDVAEKLERDRREPRLRVALGRRRVAVDRPEVPVTVHQRCAQREVLRHPDQRVVDREVAVRVVLAHHAADDVGRLAVRAVRPKALFEHRPQDPAVDRFQTVADVRQRAPDDDGHRVVQVRGLDLVLELNVLDPPAEHRLLRHRTSRSSATRLGSARRPRCPRSIPSERRRPHPSGSRTAGRPWRRPRA